MQLLLCLQADGNPYLQLLPNTGMTIAVSFYNTAPDKLVQQHAIIACLLQVCPKERRGCYTVSTADMMNATNMPATQVSKPSYIGHALSACK